MRSPVIALAVVGAVALPGCGGGSKEDAAKQVNAICRDFNAKSAAVFKNITDMKSFATEAPKLGPAITEAGRRLDNVKVSEDVKKKYGADYTRFVQNFAQTITAFATAVAAAQAGDEAAFKKAVADGDRLDKEGKPIARKLGFTECAKG
jgi:hypothetical protein